MSTHLGKFAAVFCGMMALLLAGELSARAQGWRPASAPLMTRWAKDVSPDKTRAEYPRPQFVRQDWKSLNGLWEFAFDDADMGRSTGWFSSKSLPEKIVSVR